MFNIHRYQEQIKLYHEPVKLCHEPVKLAITANMCRLWRYAADEVRLLDNVSRDSVGRHLQCAASIATVKHRVRSHLEALLEICVVLLEVMSISVRCG